MSEVRRPWGFCQWDPILDYWIYPPAKYSMEKYLDSPSPIQGVILCVVGCPWEILLKIIWKEGARDSTFRAERGSISPLMIHCKYSIELWQAIDTCQMMNGTGLLVFKVFLVGPLFAVLVISSFNFLYFFACISCYGCSPSYGIFSLLIK